MTHRGLCRALAAVLLGVTLAAPAAPASAEAPFLWRVERGGRVSHLFGTVHVGLDLRRALGEAGETALDGAERVFVEVDLTAPGVLDEFGRGALARAELPPGQSLRALLRPAAWDRLTALYRGTLPPAALDRMQPWFVTLTTLPLVVARETGRATPVARGGPPPLDAAIAARAHARGIKVMPLETPLQQIQAFIGMGRKEGAAMLEELLLRPAAERAALAGLVGAYAADDERSLQKAFGRLVRRQPALAEQLLVRRNQAWCERLDLWLGDGRIFVAAGLFHMFGDQGLPALLARRGYRVTRVRGDGSAPLVRQ